MKTILVKILLPLFLAFPPGALRAAAPQGEMGPMMFTAATTWHEAGANRDWAYLTWIGTTPASVVGRSYAIYAKPGDINAPGIFRRVAVTSVQTDPRVIEPLLLRSASVGEDLVELEVDVTALFGKFIPAGLSRSAQVAAVITGVMMDEKRFGNLAVLARAHPGMAMSLGMAHAEPIGPGQTTFEIRQFDMGTQKDVAVVGRVSVEAGNPTIMPAPGAPVTMPAEGGRGNMNTQLRWATPDALRRVMLLQHGFNVYRVRQDFAEAPGRQWHLTPPTPATLQSVLGTTSAVLRINRQPILTSTLFTPASVANFNPTNGDATTIYLIDDNDIGRPGVPPLSLDYTNGGRFYYFVAARDILGRDGRLSPGTLVTICDKLFPNAIEKVRVVNDYLFNGTTNEHHLRIIWPQASNHPTNEEQITRYWVYRWNNTHQINTNLQFPSNNLIAIVSHVPGLPQNSYLDNGPGSPAAPAGLSKTYWYTVRAEDSGACGANLSPHSPAASGVLRDREGPDGPGGRVRVQCLSPKVAVSLTSTNPNVGTPTLLDFAVDLVRDSDRILWMEAFVEIRANGSNILTSVTSGQLHFQPGAVSNRWKFQLPGQYQSRELYFRARAGMNDGQISNFPLVVGEVGKLQEDTEIQMLARAYLDTRRDGDCEVHMPNSPQGSNNIVPIEIEIIPTAGSREYRLYRRVDDGPLQLICQKTWPATNPPPLVLCLDGSFPGGGARICYYGQLFDEHGNASPLTALGCKLVLSPLPLPKPMLTPIDPTGTEANPQMYLRWFSPKYGVKRFQIGISAPLEPGNLPTNLNLSLTTNAELHVLSESVKFLSQFTVNQESNSAPPKAGSFGVLKTPVIGNGTAMGSGPEFILPVNITKGVKYAVWIRAVGVSGEVGEKSNVETFFWEPPGTNTLPTVDWPTRPLLPTVSGVSQGFLASWQTNQLNLFTGAVVQIGYIVSNNVASLGQPAFAPAQSDFAARPQVLRATPDPMVYLQPTPQGQSPFPAVLYRYQVPNGKFPTVSGDIVQCSPMMESIAHERVVSNSVVYAVIRDPFVIYNGLFQNLGNGGTGILQTLLRDTNPVLAGARYKYLLVRFGRNGEIAEVIATNEMEVP